MKRAGAGRGRGVPRREPVRWARAAAAALAVFWGGAACFEAKSAQGVVAPDARAEQGDGSPVLEGPVFEGPCVPAGPELCFNALDDNCNGLLDEGCGVHSGLVHFMAAWAEEGVDVDLHVTDPGGEVAEVGHVSESGLTKLQDCPGKQNLCYGQNYESVYLEGDEPAVGSYRVGVRLDALGADEPPITVRIGARLGDASYNRVVRLMHEGDEREVTFRLDGHSGAGGLGVPSPQSGTSTR